MLTRLAIGSEGTRTRASTATATLAQGTAQRPQQRRWGALEHSRWPLVVVLLIQSALSLRLVWTNTAYTDEALYLWSGHMEWSHWLYGTQIPALPGYFSGAPVVYPPIAAYADTVAGLTGARILSLFFMLVTTTLLHGVTRRIFGGRAAIFSAGLFISLGSTQFLGAFATYDAMALMMLALATWLGVRATGCRLGCQVALVLCSAVMLAVANAAKYASSLFDPIVIATIVLFAWHARGRNVGIRVGAILCPALSLILLTVVSLGGSVYWRGISSTTLSRANGTSPIFGILYVSVGWVGVIMALAVIGAIVVFATWRDLPMRLLGLVLSIAPFLAPAEQARIHVFTSLFKHVGYGAWFGAVVAGYALASFLRAVPTVKANAAEAVSVTVVALAMVSGVLLATDHFVAGWPDVAVYTVDLRPWVESARGQILMDEPTVEEYYSPALVRWQHVDNNVSFAYTDPVTKKHFSQSTAAYADAIRNQYFSLIALTYGDPANVYDPVIVRDIERYGGYKLVLDLPYRASNRGAFMVWARTATP